MTTRLQDRRERSQQIILLAPLAAGVVLAAVVAVTAFGGGGGGGRGGHDGGAAPRPATPSPATPVATPDPNDGGSDAMPIKVDLDNATGADVHVDIADRSGLLVDAGSGTPGDGMSVEPYTLKVENVDATTLKLTWVDFPIDSALALYIDRTDAGIRLVLVQPEPTGPTDAVGFDRELVLSFSEPVWADQVEAFLQDGLDTPG